jgi:hypothetical protein
MNKLYKYLVVNFVAVVICTGCAIFQAYNGNIGICFKDIMMALINLPFTILWVKWLKERVD